MSQPSGQRQGSEALLAAARSLGNPHDLHKKITRRMALVDTTSLVETLSVCALGQLNDEWYVDIEYLISNALSIPPTAGRPPAAEQDLLALFRLARRLHSVEMWTAMGDTEDGLAASVALHSLEVRVKADAEQMLQESMDRYETHDRWMTENLGFPGRAPALFAREVLSAIYRRAAEAFSGSPSTEPWSWGAHTHTRKVEGQALQLPDAELRRRGVNCLRLGRSELHAAAVRANCEQELDALVGRLSQTMGVSPPMISRRDRSSLYDRPFVAFGDDTYLLPLPTTLPECVADAFLQDMLRDRAYKASTLATKGSIAEQRCLKVLQRAAHKDFTFANPRKADGKEFADAAVWIGDTLAIVQSKSRHLPETNGRTDLEALNTYVRKTVHVAVKQASGARRALYQGTVITLENSRRGSVTLDRSVVNRVFLIVLLDERLPFSSLDELGVKAGPGSDQFPHIFYLNDLELVLAELDTPSDFFDYLEAREELQRRGKYDVSDEMDILAYYLLHGRGFPPAEKEDEVGWIDLDGFWQQYTEGGGPRDQRREADAISYYVDSVIDFAHTAGGQYIRAAELLATLTRLERRMVAKRAWEKALAAVHSDRPRYDAVLLSRAGFGLVMMYSKEKRGRRAEILQGLTTLAQHIFNVQTMLGVASEPADQERTSFDFLRIDAPGFTPDPGTLAVARQFFAAPDTLSETEYPAQSPPGEKAGNHP